MYIVPNLFVQLLIFVFFFIVKQKFTDALQIFQECLFS